MKTWNIILCHTLAEAGAAQTFITTNYPAGTVVYLEKDPPVAPAAANMNVVVWEYTGGVIVPRKAQAGDNGPFYVVHAITP
jgi:hypothetical protein